MRRDDCERIIEWQDSECSCLDCQLGITIILAMIGVRLNSYSTMFVVGP